MAPLPPILGFIEARRYVDPTSSREEAYVLSSLELDKRSADASDPSHLPTRSLETSTSPLEQHKTLTARDDSSTFKPGAGSKPATDFNNAGFLALFAIIGAAMVVAAIWFFFWAKNGGFQFNEGDWDDYKSTVLRRKGPDGKTLSNATKSTKLGGGSSIAGTQHFKWQKQAAHSVIGKDEKGRKGVLGKRGWAKTHSITYSDDNLTESWGTNTVSDMTEMRTEADFGGHGKRYRDRDVADYKREKPARVGGLNRVADGNGSHFASTIAGSETMSESSEQPMLSSQRKQQKEQERAERKARDDAARMERRWKREAEEAAAALARENARPPPPPTHSTRKSAAPSSKPGASKQRASSRSNSPQKKSQPMEERDFSYQSGPASEILSTAYTASTSQTGVRTERTTSYYDKYRPANTASDYSASERGGGGDRRSRQSSPQKSRSPRKGGGRTRDGGYRRGADSDLD